ncbi:YraN family protein [Candidatus Giovannonibacteria bacterium]|nr:YraN family protein [Candidatus Giovannonibacteria bacterium]
MKTQKTGQIGEGLAVIFLEKKGFKIIERNYRKKWGEIDIIASKEGILHFVEVKAISNLNYNPEDNIRAWKKLRLSRAIRTYFPDRKMTDEQEFVVDVIAVFLDFLNKKARIRMLESVIL